MTGRHIAVLTGKRGGYGAMKPMLRAIADDPGLRLSLLVTDQHVNPKFGATISEVARDFVVSAGIDMEQTDDTPRARARAIGVGLVRMADVFAELRPDILVLYGDRGEVLAAATAAVTQRIPIAHLQGGDLSGNVDELIRHAVTKLSHLHFPSTEDSAARLRGMGEEPWRIHVVGDSHVDPIVAGEYTSEAVVRRQFDIPDRERPIIVLQHPETIRNRDQYADMRGTLEAVLDLGHRTVVVYPCSDSGYEGVIEAIKEFEDHPGLTAHTNIDAPDFWGLMAIAAVFVGNSSAGLIETPYFGIPAVNVGERQKGRKRARNLIDCEHGRENVARALATALDDAAFARRVNGCDRPFGDGKAGQRVVAVLKDVALGDGLFDKRMTF